MALPYHTIESVYEQGTFCFQSWYSVMLNMVDNLDGKIKFAEQLNSCHVP